MSANQELSEWYAMEIRAAVHNDVREARVNNPWTSVPIRADHYTQTVVPVQHRAAVAQADEHANTAIEFEIRDFMQSLLESSDPARLNKAMSQFKAYAYRWGFSRDHSEQAGIFQQIRSVYDRLNRQGLIDPSFDIYLNHRFELLQLVSRQRRD